VGARTDRVDKVAMADRGVASPIDGAEPATGGRGRLFASCGKPLPGYRVEIRDEKGRLLPERRVGDVFVTGPSLMDGYHAQPETTRQCIGEDGWLDTGDMGYLADGRLFITGRRKDMIIVKGRNIWPQDLEWHVDREVPGLRSGDTAAFGHESEDGHEIAVILVQCRVSDEGRRESLRKEVSSVISRNCSISCRVELIPPRALPFTTSGKLIRTRARQRWLEGAYDCPEPREEIAVS